MMEVTCYRKLCVTIISKGFRFPEVSAIYPDGAARGKYCTVITIIVIIVVITTFKLNSVSVIFPSALGKYYGHLVKPEPLGNNLKRNLR
jgi:hypothetical protein